MDRLGTSWVKLNSSFWFLPGLLTVGGALLFAVTLSVDQAIDADISDLPIIFSGGVVAARTVLATIAGSLITVVTTVFSLTIVALQLASSHYSPRILQSFVGDRGVQTVLGVFIGTFVYALLILRIIRTTEGEATSAFIPIISVTTAVLLAIFCVGFLIYFIHHIVTLIQSSTIVRSAHRDTAGSLARLDDRRDAPEDDSLLRGRPEFEGLLQKEPLVLRARQSNYLQYVDTDYLVGTLARAGDEKVVVDVPFGPGLFVSAGLPILRVWPVPENGLDPRSEKRLRRALSFGKERSFQQDFAFGIRQLADIALKGVSPGVNDPTTSMQALDRIEAILIALGSKSMPPHAREHKVNGTKVLVKVGYYSFDDVVGLAFDQLRRASFTSGQVAVLERLLEVIERALESNALPERWKPLWDRAFAVGRLAPGQIRDPRDAANLTLRTVRIGVCLAREDRLGATAKDDLEELLGASEGLPGEKEIQEAVEAARC